MPARHCRYRPPAPRAGTESGVSRAVTCAGPPSAGNRSSMRPSASSACTRLRQVTPSASSSRSASRPWRSKTRTSCNSKAGTQPADRTLMLPTLSGRPSALPARRSTCGRHSSMCGRIPRCKVSQAANSGPQATASAAVARSAAAAAHGGTCSGRNQFGRREESDDIAGCQTGNPGDRSPLPRVRARLLFAQVSWRPARVLATLTTHPHPTN
jgi:hypothetical protein